MRKRRYSFKDKSQSKRGIWSCLMGAGALLLIGISIGAAYVRMGQAGKFIAILGLMALILAGVGLYFGFLGTKEQDSYQLFPRLGCGMNIIIILICLEIYILGW